MTVTTISKTYATQEGVTMKRFFLLFLFLLLLNVPVIRGDTVLVGTFFNGNNSALNSRAYLWNPTTADTTITARVYTLPLTGPSTLLGTINLGILNARSGKNIKIAEEILFQLGLSLPYTNDGGNLLVEFTLGADNVRGTAQVFSSNMAFGTYPLEVMNADSSQGQTTKEAQLQKLIGFWNVRVPGLVFPNGSDTINFVNTDIRPDPAVDFALSGVSELGGKGYTIWDEANQNYLTFALDGGIGNIYRYTLAAPDLAQGCAFITDANFQNPSACIPMDATNLPLVPDFVISPGPVLP
jgi:hypothetical protein